MQRQAILWTLVIVFGLLLGLILADAGMRETMLHKLGLQDSLIGLEIPEIQPDLPAEPPDSQWVFIYVDLSDKYAEREQVLQQIEVLCQGPAHLSCLIYVAHGPHPVVAGAEDEYELALSAVSTVNPDIPHASADVSRILEHGRFQEKMQSRFPAQLHFFLSDPLLDLSGDQLLLPMVAATRNGRGEAPQIFIYHDNPTLRNRINLSDSIHYLSWPES